MAQFNVKIVDLLVHVHVIFLDYLMKPFLNQAEHYQKNYPHCKKTLVNLHLILFAMILFKPKKNANMGESNRFVARVLRTVVMVKPDCIAENVVGMDFASTIKINTLVKNAK